MSLPILIVLGISSLWCRITFGLLKIKSHNLLKDSVGYGSLFTIFQVISSIFRINAMAETKTWHFYTWQSVLLCLFSFLIFRINKLAINSSNWTRYSFVLCWCFIGGAGFHLALNWYFDMTNSIELP